MSDDVSSHLRELGLSEKEIAVYLAVLDHGEAPVSTVADEVDVSQRYVYDLVGNLAGRGFLEEDDHVTPTVVRATPPEELVDALTSRLETLRPKLESRRGTVTEGRLPFEVLRSRPPVKGAMEDLIGSAENELVVDLPGSVVEQAADALRDAVDRGVLVLLLCSEVDELPVDPDGLASAVRTRRYWSPSAVAVDVDRVGLVPPDELFSAANPDFAAVRIQQPNMVYLLRSAILGQEWPMAVEAYAAPPVDLPAHFGWFHAGVLQAARHLDAGTDLRATVEAQPARADGDYERFSGEVTSITQGFVEPRTNDVAFESTLHLDGGGEVVSVGGPGAVHEDLEARWVKLEAN